MLRAILSINQSMLSDIIQEAENIHHIADMENNIEFFLKDLLMWWIRMEDM